MKGEKGSARNAHRLTGRTSHHQFRFRDDTGVRVRRQLLPRWWLIPEAQPASRLTDALPTRRDARCEADSTIRIMARTACHVPALNHHVSYGRSIQHRMDRGHLESCDRLRSCLAGL